MDQVIYIPRKGDGKTRTQKGWIFPYGTSFHECEGGGLSDPKTTYLIPVPAKERWVILECGKDTWREGDYFRMNEGLSPVPNHMFGRAVHLDHLEGRRRLLLPDVEKILNERNEAQGIAKAAVQQNASLQSQLDAATKERDELIRERKGCTEARTTAESERDALQSKLVAAEKERDADKERLDLAVGIVLRVSELLGFTDFGDPAPLYAEIENLKKERAGFISAFRRVFKDAQEMGMRLTLIDSSAEDAKDYHSDMERRAESAEARVRELEAALKEATASCEAIAAISERHEGRILEARNERDKVEEQLSALENKHTNLTAHASGLEQQLSTLRAENEKLTGEIDEYKELLGSTERERVKLQAKHTALLDSLRWVPVSERMPTLDDADKVHREVLVWHKTKGVIAVQFNYIDKEDYTHWKPGLPGPEPAKSEAQRIAEAWRKENLGYSLDMAISLVEFARAWKGNQQ